MTAIASCSPVVAAADVAGAGAAAQDRRRQIRRLQLLPAAAAPPLAAETPPRPLDAGLAPQVKAVEAPGSFPEKAVRSVAVEDNAAIKALPLGKRVVPAPQSSRQRSRNRDSL